MWCFNPRTKNSHPHRGTRAGVGFMEPLSSIFEFLQNFETILPSVENLLRPLNKMRYIVWVVALLEAAIFDFTKN